MFSNAFPRWGALLGFALGGFFDGILLHQILQWHHLLSLVEGVDSLRLQVLWDGYFHAFMYVVAAVGLWGLWRSRRTANDRGLAGAMLAGFGLWHIVDSLLSHWILGIHRIRLDSPDPLLWDMIWLAAFGILPLLLAWPILRRQAMAAAASRSGTLPLLALFASGMAAWAAQPSTGQRFTTLVFSPAISPAEAVNAVLAEGGTLVWSDRAMGVLVIDVAQERRRNFYLRGALLVSGSGTPGGCFNWSAA